MSDWGGARAGVKEVSSAVASSVEAGERSSSRVDAQTSVSPLGSAF